MVSFFSVFRHRCAPLLAVMWAIPVSLAAQGPSSNTPSDVVIQNATVMTVTHGTIPHGSVWIHNGKIARVGATINAPAGARTIDAAGKVRYARNHRPALALGARTSVKQVFIEDNAAPMVSRQTMLREEYMPLTSKKP